MTVQFLVLLLQMFLVFVKGSDEVLQFFFGSGFSLQAQGSLFFQPLIQQGLFDAEPGQLLGNFLHVAVLQHCLGYLFQQGIPGAFRGW